MTKLINLDKYRLGGEFEHNGKKYTLRTTTVGEYINATYPEPEYTEDNKQLIDNIANYISNFTNMPLKELLNLDIAQLNILHKAVRGIEVEDDSEVDKKK